MEIGEGLTWLQRRELERELWLDLRLRALADVSPDDLDDPVALRAIESHATAVAELVGRLRAMRGDEAAVAGEVAAFRAQLDAQA